MDSEPIELNVVVDNGIFLASPYVAKIGLNKNRIFIQPKADSLSRKQSSDFHSSNVCNPFFSGHFERK